MGDGKHTHTPKEKPARLSPLSAISAQVLLLPARRPKHGKLLGHPAVLGIVIPLSAAPDAQRDTKLCVSRLSEKAPSDLGRSCSIAFIDRYVVFQFAIALVGLWATGNNVTFKCHASSILVSSCEHLEWSAVQ